MWIRLAAVIAFGIFGAGAAYAQTPVPNPTRQTTIVAGDQIPIFRVTVVGRTTQAINYRPRRGDTKIDFAATPLMSMARGNATVSGEKGYIRIQARFDKLGAPAQFGPEYLTYVLWAITPEGRATNLGEVQRDDDDAKVDVTTELQAFGLILTAEPYFAVTQPSDVVVLENVARDNTNGKVETIQAKYELLQRGSYLMNQDAARLKIKALEPGVPLDLAQARNAVELARLAGADKYSPDTFTKAAGLLGTAEEAREKRRNSNTIMMPARQAVQTAEDARLVGLQRQEEALRAEQRRLAQQREQEATERARAEAERARAEGDRARLEAERARAESERRRVAELEAQNAAAARAAAEREAQAAAEQARAAAEQKALAERNAQEALAQQAAAQRAKADADAARSAAEAARAEAETARAQADAARRDAEAQASHARNLAAQSEREKAELRDRLREQLNVILETRETARGLIVNLSDVLFDTASANLKPGAREKLARVSGILSAHPGLKMEIEGHTDSVGTDEYNQRLSERRADSVRTYLVAQRITPASIAARGFGEAQPVATNGNAAGRQQNRRVELIVSGDIIGTSSAP